MKRRTNGLTSSQISEWLAYSSLDPIGEDRADYRMSYLASLLTNLTIQVYGKKNAKLTTIDDFLLRWGESPEDVQKRQSVEEMKQILLGFAKSHNARLAKQKRHKR